MMNVGLPAVNFVDCKSDYRPFVLLSKGVPPHEEWKTLRIVKPQHEPNLIERRDPTYRSRRPTPYSDNREKDEMSKPIKLSKKVITSVTIDKPFGFIDNDLAEKALAVIAQTKDEENSYESDMTVDLSLKNIEEINNNNKTDEKKL